MYRLNAEFNNTIIDSINNSQKLYEESIKRISTGKRINSAMDDAAGLSISEELHTQEMGLEQANRNIQDAVSMLNIADATISSGVNFLQKGRTLLVQYGNDTNNESSKQTIVKEINSLLNEWDNILDRTEFNDKKLFSGDFSQRPIIIQTGANAGETEQLNFNDLYSLTLGLSKIDENGNKVLNEETKIENVGETIDILDRVVDYFISQQSDIGAKTNKLLRTINLNTTIMDNYSLANERIVGVDIAKEISNINIQQIRMNAATAMFAQSNMNQQRIYHLLFQ